MKDNINTAHRLSSFAKKNNGRSDNSRVANENNSLKNKVNSKEKIVVTKVMMPEPPDIIDVRERADEDRPE